MTDYPFSSWRRLIFVAALIIILVLTLTPAVTKGNINIRVYALLPHGIVKHLYTTFTNVQVHVAGLPESTGWSTVNQNPTAPNVDLIPQSNQLLPSKILTTSIPSGRYDAIRMTYSNSTLVLQNGQNTGLAPGLLLTANATISIPPNGNGDVLFILLLDYSLLVSTSPSISASILQVTSF